MSGLFGSTTPTTQAQQAPTASGITIQTSVYGKALGIGYGRTRVAPNIMWYDGFVATPHYQPAASQGGKGGFFGVGNSTGGTTTYTYSANVIWGLCEGRIIDIQRVWVQQSATTTAALNMTVFDGDTTNPSPWTFLQSNYPAAAFPYNGIACVGAAPADLGDNAQLPNVNFEADLPLSGTGPDGISADPSGVITDLLSNTNYGAGFPANAIGTLVTVTENFSITSGTGQSVTVSHAAKFADNLSVSVNGVTLKVGAANTGSYSYVNGVYNFGSDSVGHTASITYYYLVGLTAYHQFCFVTGLGINPFYDTQQPVAQMISDIVKYTFSEIVWSCGIMTVVPRGTQTITANGVTYIAPSEVLFNLTDDDFVPQSSTDPVVLTRVRVSDQDNVIQLEYLDSTNAYAPGIAEVTDQASVDRFRRRFSGSQQAHLFTNATMANTSAQFLMQKQFIRNSYTFTLDERYCLLDPMDLVSITDTNLGLNAVTVRIASVTEQSDGTLQFVAEEYPVGLGANAEYELSVGAGYNQDYNVAVAPINKPIVFEAPVQIATSGLEIWSSVSSPDPNFGGVNVWLSSDGTTYKQVTTHWGRSRQGALSAVLPFGADPDESNPIHIDLSMSRGQLLSGTEQDADLGNTLCYVDGELLSYETAEMGDAFQYILTGYIRRGQYGSPITAHAFGSDFVRCDEGTIKISYDSSLIGHTVYIKYTTFNIWGGGTESLSDATPYSHLVVGPPPPGPVQGFIVSQQDGLPVVFEWQDLSDYALKGYDILYGPIGGTVDNATVLTEATRSTEMTNASVPPGIWIFYIRGHDIVGQLGQATSYQFKVVQVSGSILEDANAPDWFDAVAASASGHSSFSKSILTPGSSGIWVVPNGVSNYIIHAIGSGGDGGIGPDGSIGAGGGGGAYASKSLTLASGTQIPFSIGFNGTPTWFGSTTTLYADGGQNASGSTPGNGGRAASSIGDLTFSGGNGAAPTNILVSYQQGGGGGGAGGPNGAGSAAPFFGTQSSQPELLTATNDFGDGAWGLGNVTAPTGAGPVVVSFGAGGAYLTTGSQFTPTSNTTYIISALVEAVGGSVNPNLLLDGNDYANATYWEQYNCSGNTTITFPGGQAFLTTKPQFSPSSNTTYTVSAYVSNATTNLRFAGNDGNGNLIGPSAEITPPSGGGRISWTVQTGTIGTATVANFALTGDVSDAACTFNLSDFKVEVGSVMTTGLSGNKNFRFSGNDGNGNLIGPSPEFSPSLNGTRTTWTVTTGVIGSTTPNFSMTTDIANDAAQYKISNFSIKVVPQSQVAYGGTGVGGVANGGIGGIGGIALNPNLLLTSDLFSTGKWGLSGVSIESGDGPVIAIFNPGSAFMHCQPQFNPQSDTTYMISALVEGSVPFRFFFDDGNGNKTYSSNITPDGTRKGWSFTTTTTTGNSFAGMCNGTNLLGGTYAVGFFKIEAGSVMTWAANAGSGGVEFGVVGSGGGSGAGGSPASGGVYGGGGGGVAQKAAAMFNPSNYGGNLLTASNNLSDPAWQLFANTSVSGNVVIFT